MGWWEASLNWLRRASKCGKTSLINVVEIGFHMREVIKGNVTFKIWDASGQSRFRSSWERFVHVGVLLSCCRYVDAADLDNLFISKNELHKLCKTSLNGIPLLVLGNKMDEPGLSLKKP
ncbi:hypothetical protein DY000_02040586 [Brassica cretica]|uniref:Uncharacterized protein n=1 Tax=Brassica cretica TaxID=69181 RepID=A0ABQ7BG33_BRACR|nr:hypothetical protein DY000_02040586 [Brassica cretica]